MIQMAATSIQDIVEQQVRAEHEDAIRAEVERRMAAVTAAIAGGVEPPPPPRRPRSDKGTRRPRPAGADMPNTGGVE